MPHTKTSGSGPEWSARRFGRAQGHRPYVFVGLVFAFHPRNPRNPFNPRSILPLTSTFRRSPFVLFVAKRASHCTVQAS